MDEQMPTLLCGAFQSRTRLMRPSWVMSTMSGGAESRGSTRAVQWITRARFGRCWRDRRGLVARRLACGLDIVADHRRSGRSASVLGRAGRAALDPRDLQPHEPSAAPADLVACFDAAALRLAFEHGIGDHDPLYRKFELVEVAAACRSVALATSGRLGAAIAFGLSAVACHLADECIERGELGGELQLELRRVDALRIRDQQSPTRQLDVAQDRLVGFAKPIVLSLDRRTQLALGRERRFDRREPRCQRGFVDRARYVAHSIFLIRTGSCCRT